MSWFEKDLNRTVIIATFFAWILGILLVSFSLYIAGWNYLPFPGESYIPYNPHSTASTYTFTLQAIVDVAIFASLPVYFWVLKKKNRTVWFLLFFLPPLIPTPILFFLIFFQMPFWLAGWMILLGLKAKTAANP